jgi:hypothetical protein
MNTSAKMLDASGVLLASCTAQLVDIAALARQSRQ